MTRSGRCVKESPIQEEDYDSHDSYESAEDEFYKPPKNVGDNFYSSDSDSDSEKSAPRKNKKSEAREKHKPPKFILGDKEIDTDDSSFEGFEDEERSKSGAEPELNAVLTDADIATEVEAPLPSLISPIQTPLEIDISQSESIPPTQDTQQDQLVARPPKLQVIKRKTRLSSSPKPTATTSVAVSAETIKGTSSGTAKRLDNFMTFVPTPGFKAPKKNNEKV
ncbi:hypothetical protein Ahy_A06g026660 [Arachis hypogaea]|uniref:Uncharacterized protein n=1 Tax=Arachis hypogaea TaxID=3818 RepID=A0A445CL89_ARAHY|nr:hypothetical protein Ahy_A06g026660 [Arachis hypogaea]